MLDRYAQGLRVATVGCLYIIYRRVSSICLTLNVYEGGHVKLAWPMITSLAKEHGVEKAAEVAQFHISQIYAMKEAIEKEKIDCDFALRRSYDVYLSKTEPEYANVLLDHQLMADVAVSKHVEFMDTKYAEQVG